MRVRRLLPALLPFLFIAFDAAAAPAQTPTPMPAYVAHAQLTGTLRIRGDYHQRAMLSNWEREFAKFQPGIRFENNLTSTVHGIPALVFGLADIALLGREIAPLENLAFRRMFRYDPLDVATATGSFDTPYQAFALGVFVNHSNPLTQLTLEQVAAVFGCGPGRNLRTWGQLGLTGRWASKAIHVLGYPSDNNIAAFFELKVLDAGDPTGEADTSAGGPTLPSGARWNCDLKEYANTYDSHDRPVVSSDAFMMRDLGADPYAIAYSGIAEKTVEVKPLALAVRSGSPFIPFTREAVADRSYPLTRTMYAYMNKAPGRPLDPAVAEFLKFILSREGQEAVVQQKIFLPLTAVAVAEQRKKIQ